MDIKHVSKQYRPIPFWSWNEKLDIGETTEQVEIMEKAGIGGFFMHARGGLQTEYMSEEWFENMETAICKAEEYGMRPWAYDENGWPSGFGNGMVNGLGISHQQKFLRMESSPEHKEHQIGQSGEHYFYYEVNPYYVDTLDEKVVREFIERIYTPYYERFGNRIEGFFTDEPQVSRDGIPWSFVMEEEYAKRYGEALIPHLEELFLPKGDYVTTRIRFWKMVTELFSESYFKQIYEWCQSRGLKLTGHLVGEGKLSSQITTNGACMSHYEYYHIPGMDWLGRNIRQELETYQVASVAEQLGKKEVLSETFAACGHNISMAELKGIYEWQMVRGINLLCPHLEGYSLRGLRKRDWPPAMYYQQPWWTEYDKWVDAMSRIGMILAEGDKRIDVLVIHPIVTAWALYDSVDVSAVDELDRTFMSLIGRLEQKHIGFHLGDEIIMERHAVAQGGKLLIGNQQYSYVIDTCCTYLLDSTKALLEEFQAQGGHLVSVDELEANYIVEDETITYTQRFFEGEKVHYFVNSSPDIKEVKIHVQGQKVDVYTGEKGNFSGTHRFEPWGSLIIVEDGTRNIDFQEKDITENYLDGIFVVDENTLNILTLDTCDYYFDGELQEKNGFILNVSERANRLERKVKLHMDFAFCAEAIPRELYLVTEVPEQFDIRVNGQEINKDVVGYFQDKSFKKIDISSYLEIGNNVISYDCDFVQSKTVYENIYKARRHESEKNKLAYDMEIEPIYLLGTFGVKTEGEWTKLDNDAVRYHGKFVLDKPVREINLSHIEKQGFPFFCGEMKVEGMVDVKGDNPVLVLDFAGINAIRIEMAGLSKTVLTDDRISLKSIPKGKHPIRLTLINNLRNLLGPHHLEKGESHFVTPGHFYKDFCIWRKVDTLEHWNDDYCFVKFGR